MLIKNISQYIGRRLGDDKDVGRIECFIVLLAVAFARRFHRELFPEDENVFIYENKGRKREPVDFYIPLLRSRLKNCDDGDPDWLEKERPELRDMLDSIMPVFEQMSTTRLRSFILRFGDLRRNARQNGRVVFVKD